MKEINNSTSDQTPRRTTRPRWPRVLGIIALCLLVIALIIAGWMKYNLYASPFRPVRLSETEKRDLNAKLALLTDSQKSDDIPPPVRHEDSPGPLEPERYSEEGARREISLTEKELNGMITKDPEVARRVAIDLSDDMVSVKLVIPVDEGVILFGGKTLRLNMGIMLSYINEKPVVGIQGISIGGIPLPDAWLGYMKGKNLIEEFGTEAGFWKLFAEGVQDIQVKEGHLNIRLKE